MLRPAFCSNFAFKCTGFHFPIMSTNRDPSQVPIMAHIFEWAGLPKKWQGIVYPVQIRSNFEIRLFKTWYRRKRYVR